MSTSLLELDLSASTGEIILTTEVPAQDLTLKSYRVQFSSTGSIPPVIYVQLPFIGASSTVTTGNKRGIPILCTDSLYQVQNCDTTVGINQAIPERFRYTLDVASGALTNFVRLTLVFEYSVGSIF